MRLKDEQIARLADTIVNDLTAQGLVRLQGERGALLKVVRETIAANVAQEAALEKEAERLLEQTLRGTGGGVGIDRHKMLRMIKERLAKERKFVL